MKKLLLSLFILLPVIGQAQLTGNGGLTGNQSSGGALSPIAPFNALENQTASTANPTAVPKGAVNVASYIGPCIGGSYNSCATTAANAASAAGLALYFPAGTYPLADWSPPCPLNIYGDGEGNTIFKRPNSTSASAIVSVSGCNGLQVHNLTLDGNKANETTSAHGIRAIASSYNLTFDHLEIKNNKTTSSDALLLDTTADDANGTHTEINSLYIHDNEGFGIYGNIHAWNFTIHHCVILANGKGGINIQDLEFPPVSGQFANFQITNNDSSHNSGAGIQIIGFITGGSSAHPTNGAFDAARDGLIANNTVTFNQGYGITAQGTRLVVANNVANNSGPGTGSVAGILANCNECDMHDNIVRGNEFYGIDAGGSTYSLYHNNVIEDNGNATFGSGNGINCGACQHTDITDNFLRNNGWTGDGVQIHATLYDAGLSGIPTPTQDVRILRNRMISGNANQAGLQFLEMGPTTNSIIEDNFVSVSTPMRAFAIECTSCQVHRNRQDTYLLQTSVSGVASSYVIPDALEELNISTATGNSVTALVPHFYSIFTDGIYTAVITAGGSGYSLTPTISFSGGGCAVQPTGTVTQDNAGHVVGFFRTTTGSGCTSAPTATINDGSGVGATATAYTFAGVTTLPVNSRELKIQWGSGITVSNAATNMQLLRNQNFTVPAGQSYISTFNGWGGAWREVNRYTPTAPSGSYVLCTSGAATTHTGDTAETNLAVCSIPPNTLGPNAVVRVTTSLSRTAAGTNTVSYVVRLSGTSGDVAGGMILQNFNNAASAGVAYNCESWVRNANATNAQQSSGNSQNACLAIGASYGTNGTGTQDTTTQQYINFNCKDTTSSADTCGFYGYTVEVLVP